MTISQPFIWTIFVVFVAVFVSLLVSLFTLIKDDSGRQRTIRGLTVRVCLCLSLFGLLIYAWSQGWIVPHTLGLRPV